MKGRTMHRLLIAATVALVTACGGGPESDGSLEIGTSTQSGTDPSALPFLPVQDGAELVLEPGAQGGFHVFMHLRVDDFVVAGVERPFVQRKARRVDTGELVSRGERTHAFVDAKDPGMVELEAPVPLFLCPTPIGIEVADQELELEVEVSIDDETPGVKAKLRFTPRCPEGDQNQFCRNICFG